MKNKKTVALCAMTIALSCLFTACNFGGEEPDQVVVEVTPTPEPTKAPDPTPTIAPDVQQSTTYTSKDKSISIELPDATWANKSDETDMVSFESPDAGKILILHGAGPDDMNVAVIPNTQDMAVSLELAADLVQGTDFEILDYTSTDVNGVGVYSYVTKMLNTEKSGGYLYVVNKYFATADEYYSLTGSVKTEEALEKVKASIESFTILGESTLKGAAGGTGATGTTGTEGTAAEGTSGEGTAAGSTGNSGGFTEEQLTDTNQTRTLYRNSDGTSFVIYADANGNWVDAQGNVYEFVTDEDVYDQDGEDYYYHGEAADVFYMPIEY